MGNENIIFRKIKKSDYKALEKIIKYTWNYDKFCSEKVANSLSKLYLASCLTNQNFTCVAVKDDVPVGIIMGKNENKSQFNLLNLLHQFFSIVEVFMTKEGRKVLSLLSCYETINNDLKANCGRKFDGEVAFFAVDSEVRGFGIGKQLFLKFKEYMSKENIKTFYLFTDTTCNYGFYDSQGMKQLATKKHHLKLKKLDVDFFIYAN